MVLQELAELRVQMVLQELAELRVQMVLQELAELQVVMVQVELQVQTVVQEHQVKVLFGKVISFMVSFTQETVLYIIMVVHILQLPIIRMNTLIQVQIGI
jgi:hypothetical protein